MSKPPPSIEGQMLNLARKHVAAKGYPQSDFAMTALVHALQEAVPVPRPVEIHQPGKSAKAREARKVALAREPEPLVPAAGACFLAACSDRPAGWRLYVHEGWQAVCSRHAGGAKAVALRMNRDLEPKEAGR